MIALDLRYMQIGQIAYSNLDIAIIIFLGIVRINVKILIPQSADVFEFVEASDLMDSAPTRS